MTTTLVPLQAGTVAPDFTLASTSGESVTLSSFRGQKHVLLAFFPLAFTGVCTSELCAFSEDFEMFASADVQVLPISVDAVPSLKEFRSKFDMKVELLSDFKREASVAYGVLRPDTFFSNSAYFVVDKAGLIAWSYVEATPRTKRENAEILDAIRAIAVVFAPHCAGRVDIGSTAGAPFGQLGRQGGCGTTTYERGVRKRPRATSGVCPRRCHNAVTREFYKLRPQAHEARPAVRAALAYREATCAEPALPVSHGTSLSVSLSDAYRSPSLLG